MACNHFTFKQFTIYQEKSAFKVGTDGVILGAYADVAGVKRILDIGTGTALIALMMAQRSNADIVGIEPDDYSYLQACENVNNCKWKNRIEVLHSTLQEYADNDMFDLIVSNPPYFSDSIRNPDPRKSFTRHNDSLSADELLKGASRLMAEGGRLQVIMPYVEGNIFIAEASEYGFFCNNIFKIRPLPTSEIRRIILTFSKQQLNPTEKFLTIEQGRRHEFTEDYKNLTKDFYLKF